MPMAQEDIIYLVAVYPCNIHLPLRALAAIEKQTLILVTEEHSDDIPILSRDHGSSTEKR